MNVSQTRTSERGNALFYILIAVALLAALTFAVSSGSRITEGSLTEDNIKLYAAEIIEYSDIVGKAVAQLRLRGCSISQLSFENDIVSGYTNGSAPSDNSCHIFHVSGGGVSWRNPETVWLDTSKSAELQYGVTYFPNSTCVLGVGTSSSASDCNSNGDEELVLIMGWLDQALCEKINDQVGMDNPGDDPPTDAVSAWANNTEFTGTLAGALEIGDGADSATFFSQKSGCFEGSGAQANGYHFYKVLIVQ